MPHDSCSGYPGKATACECAHPVACTACHGGQKFLPPASVELYTCQTGDDMDWSSLHVNDGGSKGGAMLMVGGLCLQAPADQEPVYEAAHVPAPAQRVQGKSVEDLAMEVAAPVPAVSKIRVTVTATNGIADARINEVRLYDAAGMISFPSKSKRTP